MDAIRRDRRGGAFRIAARPFCDEQATPLVRSGQELAAVRFLGENIQNFRAFRSPDKQCVNGNAQRFGDAPFFTHH